MKMLGKMIACGLLLAAAPALAQDQTDPNEPPAGPVENADPNTSADGSQDTQDQGDIMVTEAGEEDARRAPCDPRRQRCPAPQRPDPQARPKPNRQ